MHLLITFENLEYLQLKRSHLGLSIWVIHVRLVVNYWLRTDISLCFLNKDKNHGVRNLLPSLGNVCSDDSDNSDDDVGSS